MTFKFLSECSTEALQDIFDPKYKKDLKCPFSDHLLRMIIAELYVRGIPFDEKTREDFVGPERCIHGTDMFHDCYDCGDFDDNNEDEDSI